MKEIIIELLQEKGLVKKGFTELIINVNGIGSVNMNDLILEFVEHENNKAHEAGFNLGAQEASNDIFNKI